MTDLLTDQLKPLSDGIATYNGDVFKALEGGKPQVETMPTGDSLQAELRRDLACARLQLTITQALCAYIDETNADERVRLTDVQFVHNGAKVSVKVRVGEAIAQAAEQKGESAIVDRFRIMQALATMEETTMRSALADTVVSRLKQQTGCEAELRDGYLFLKNVTQEQFDKVVQEVAEETCKAGCQCGRACNSMYTSREDQERYGRGDGNVAAA
jgi:hypothetical protein